ncbi:hypothetical protein ES705_44452 [subsurface metagenome]
MKYKYHAKCSRCGLGFRANTKSEMLSKLRKHLWRKHEDWMKRRIKAGLRRRRKAQVVGVESGMYSPSIVSPHWVGFAEKALIERATGRPYEEVKTDVLDFFARQLMSGVVSGLPKTKKK